MILTAASCMLVAVALEAGGVNQSDLDRHLVAKSVETRVKANKSSCLKEVSKKHQYAWFKGVGADYSISKDSETLVKKSLADYGKIRSKLPDVTHFHSQQVKPAWSLKLRLVIKTKAHSYYG